MRRDLTLMLNVIGPARDGFGILEDAARASLAAHGHDSKSFQQRTTVHSNANEGSPVSMTNPTTAFGLKVWNSLRWRFARAAALPTKIAGLLFAGIYNDLLLARRRRTNVGNIPAALRVAVFVIYPQAGLQASHLATLRYLVAKGYAPFVISNLPLHEDDRQKVLSTCWQLLERPNFGYDFGAYRDGILALGESLESLERLVLINDSCWFPLPGASDWLDDAEALGVEFAGAASNYGMMTQRAGTYVFSPWDYRSDRPQFHYCSFALCVSGRLLNDPRFRRFWSSFRLTSDKIAVVQRGEVGLTQWVLRHGFSHASTLDVTRLDAELDQLPLQRIRLLMRELVIPEEVELRQEKRALLGRDDGSEAWRMDAVRFILLAIAQTGASYVLPEFTVKEKGFPFLKKSPVRLEKDSSDSTLRIARELAGPEGQIILAEALELRRQLRQTASHCAETGESGDSVTMQPQRDSAQDQPD